MSALRKTVAATLVALAGAAGLLVIATSAGELAQGGAGHAGVTVLADSPWGSVRP
ncbi:hypothetical protein [Actinophytocola algeriensis]|uniref:Uncharacterized protein n=1 Tax=Actinophytocola algeriensis TaxID=1768010 RepID=A0A7W7VGG6_9PSEU|nr:hypothetical protein [Actinophytocola algeriensis]MBB4909328.1 hypothetical protein [Actinophytocola algeriensis]MBE1475318.1 hypothetical protein [Actinophytocola algeriensis]